MILRSLSVRSYQKKIRVDEKCSHYAICILRHFRSNRGFLHLIEARPWIPRHTLLLPLDLECPDREICHFRKHHYRIPYRQKLHMASRNSKPQAFRDHGEFHSAALQCSTHVCQDKTDWLVYFLNWQPGSRRWSTLWNTPNLWLHQTQSLLTERISLQMEVYNMVLLVQKMIGFAPLTDPCWDT